MYLARTNKQSRYDLKKLGASCCQGRDFSFCTSRENFSLCLGRQNCIEACNTAASAILAMFKMGWTFYPSACPSATILTVFLLPLCFSWHLNMQSWDTGCKCCQVCNAETEHFKTVVCSHYQCSPWELESWKLFSTSDSMKIKVHITHTTKSGESRGVSVVTFASEGFCRWICCIYHSTTYAIMVYGLNLLEEPQASSSSHTFRLAQLRKRRIGPGLSGAGEGVFSSNTDLQWISTSSSQSFFLRGSDSHHSSILQALAWMLPPY